MTLDRIHQRHVPRCSVVRVAEWKVVPVKHPRAVRSTFTAPIRKPKRAGDTSMSLRSPSLDDSTKHEGLVVHSPSDLQRSPVAIVFVSCWDNKVDTSARPHGDDDNLLAQFDFHTESTTRLHPIAHTNSLVDGSVPTHIGLQKKVGDQDELVFHIRIFRYHKCQLNGQGYGQGYV